jgi:hypothetical protein
MALVVTAWIKLEGLALIDRRWPGWLERIAKSSRFIRIERTVKRTRALAGVDAREVA